MLSPDLYVYCTHMMYRYTYMQAKTLMHIKLNSIKFKKEKEMYFHRANHMIHYLTAAEHENTSDY